MSASARRQTPSTLYLRYAALFVAVAVGMGAWLRAIFVWPVLRGPFVFQYLVHAHSHTAFFGWVTPALFGVIVAALPRETAGRLDGRLRLHAHLLGLATVLALVAFVLGGYSVAAIAMSAVHVVLWWVFALTLLPRLGAGLGDAAGSEDRTRPEAWVFYRAALVLLLAAGTATLLPGILAARGIHEGWLRELGVKLFLTPFMGGWIGLGVMGATYGQGVRCRRGSWALRLTGMGVLPSTLLYVGEAPPWGGLVWIGRAGTLLVGLGTLAFAADVLGGARAVLHRLAGVAAALKGALEVVAGLGVGAGLIHTRPVVLAYLHLAMLGVATPILLSAARQASSPVRLPAERPGSGRAVLIGAYAVGLALMCGALVGMGWPWLALVLAGSGLQVGSLLVMAFGGGSVCAAALLGLLLAPVDGHRSPAPAVAVAPRVLEGVS